MRDCVSYDMTSNLIVNKLEQFLDPCTSAHKISPVSALLSDCLRADPFPSNAEGSCRSHVLHLRDPHNAAVPFSQSSEPKVFGERR